MRILFTTEKLNGASTRLYAGLLSKLNELPDVSIDMYKKDYAGYDVILFMGYDPEVSSARASNPSAKIGIIDPRPASGLDTSGVDFFVANGLEIKDWYSRETPHVYTYVPYPVVTARKGEHIQQKKLVLGYHGNKVHLQEMYPRITAALEALAEDYEVELRAIYNIEQLGKWRNGLPDSKKVSVKHIQWSEGAYDEHLSDADVGLVPNLMPIRDSRRLKRIGGVSQGVFLEDDTDYLIRYKASSNAGRIFVFAQFGIPVVADMFPSALQYISDGSTGFVVHSSAAWYHALKALADSVELRQSIARNMYIRFDSLASPDVQNKGLVEFIQSLPGSPPSVPSMVLIADSEPWSLRDRMAIRITELKDLVRRTSRLRDRF